MKYSAPAPDSDRKAAAPRAGGEEASFHITGTLAPHAIVNISNTAVITSATLNPEGNAISVTASSTADVVEVSALELKLITIAPDYPLIPGKQIRYTLQIDNNGPAETVGLRLDFAPPMALTDVMYQDGQGQLLPWPGSLPLAELPDGGIALAELSGTVAPGMAGEIDCTFTVSSANLDPDDTDNIIGVNWPIIDTARVTADKTADKTTYLPGETITYTMVFLNDGPSPVIAPEISDALPGIVLNPRYSVNGGQSADWPGSVILPDLAVSGSATITIAGTISADAVSGSLNNYVTLASATLNPDGGSIYVVTNTSAADPDAAPYVIDTAVLTATKASDKTAYLPGETVTYTIVVTNDGPATAASIAVTDTLPGSVQNPSYNIDGAADTPWTGSATMPDIAPGETSRLVITGVLAPDATGSLANTATITSTTPKPDGTSAPVTATTANSPNGDPYVTDTAVLTATKASDKTVYLPGETVTYTIVVTNDGPGIAAAPAISDTLPGSVQNPSYSVDGAADTPWTGSVTMPDIAPGETSRLVITGVLAPDATGSLANTATITSATPKPDGTSAPVTATTANSPNGDPYVTDTAVLTATKASDKTVYLPGETIAYTITVKNDGPATAASIAVTDSLPGSVQSTRYNIDGAADTPWTGSVTMPDIAPGATSRLVITGVLAPDATGSLENTATITSTTPKPDGTANSVSARVSSSVINIAALSVTKTADKADVLPGGAILYTVTVANAGPSTAAAPLVTDTLPASIMSPEYSLDNSASWNPWNGSVTLPDLAVNAAAAILIRGMVSEGATGTLVNTAAASSVTPRPDGSTDPVVSPPNEIAITPSSHLVTTFALDNPTPSPGDSITVTLDVANNGPAAATGVSIIERPYPPPESYRPATAMIAGDSALPDMQFSLDGGASWQPWTGNTALDDLPGGENTRMILKGSIPANAVGDIGMVLEVTSASYQPVQEDGVVMIIISVAPFAEEADLAVTACVDRPRARPCCPLTFTIEMINYGPAAAASPTLSISTSGLTQVRYSPDGGVCWLPWRGCVAHPDMTVGSVAHIMLRGVVSANACKCVTAEITAASSTTDPNPANNTQVIRVPVVTCCCGCCKACRDRRCGLSNRM